VKKPATLVSKHKTQDEAIAAAVRDLEPGGEVVIHAPHCQQRDDRADDDSACTCTPMCLRVGERN
jgi:hypothetical protein